MQAIPEHLQLQPQPWREFLTPRLFGASIAGWMLLACFLWTRDFLLVGPEAWGLQPKEMVLTAQSMVQWGLFSPFIMTTARLFEFEPGRRIRSAVFQLMAALVLSGIDVGCDMFIALFTKLEDNTFYRQYHDEVFINVFSYIIVAAIGYALVYNRRLADARMGALELQRELTQTRLDVLARTLQPHFLFNALNTVAALVRLAENRRALTAVVALGDLLRIVLKTGGDARVPLKEELEFTERYVAVERLRFEERLEVRTEATPEAAQLLVPALILQPLVENAIRHGVEVSGHGQVSIEASSTPEWLNMAVRVKSRSEGADPRVAGLGIGLDVTRRRLGYLYGEGRFALELLVGCGHSSVTLRIPREETVYVRADPHDHRG